LIASTSTKFTALEDGVEIIEEIKPHGMHGPTQRNVVKILQKGEYLRCQVVQKMVNVLASMLHGKKEPLTIWFYDLKLIYGTVDADKVRVTCVPRDSEFVREYFPDLPELKYEP
jgi:hypothetical protein